MNLVAERLRNVELEVKAFNRYLKFMVFFNNFNKCCKLLNHFSILLHLYFLQIILIYLHIMLKYFFKFLMEFNYFNCNLIF